MGISRLSRASDQSLYNCVLRHGPMTAQQVAKILGLNYRWVIEHLNSDERLTTLGVPIGLQSLKKTGRAYGTKDHRFVVKEDQ